MNTRGALTGLALLASCGPPPQPSPLRLVLDGGDYVEPAFSPDGRWLAFGEITQRDSMPIAQVLVYDFTSSKLDTVLTADSAVRYATYAAIVSETQWDGPQDLRVEIADGDVDWSELTYRMPDATLVRQEYHSADEGDSSPGSVPAERQLTLERASMAFPDLPRDVLANALRQHSVDVNGHGVIFQKNYSGYDSHIWYADFGRREMLKLVELPERSILSLGGGVTVGDHVVFVATWDSIAHVLSYRRGQVSEMARRPMHAWRAGVESKPVGGGATALLVSVGGKHSPLFLVTPDTVQERQDLTDLYDVAFDTVGGRMALVQWGKRGRRLTVRSMR